MKKILIYIFLTIILILPLTACNNLNSNNENLTPTINSEEEDEDIEVIKDEVKNKVYLIIPKKILNNEDLSGFNEAEYLAQHPEYEKAEVTEKNGLKITMTPEKHKELLYNIKNDLNNLFKELIEGKDAPYVKNIVSSDDLKEVTITVNKKQFKNNEDMLISIIGSSAVTYQSFAGEEQDMKIIILDDLTNEIILETTYNEYANKITNK